MSFKFFTLAKFKLTTPQLINPILVYQSPTDAAPQFRWKLFPFLHFLVKLGHRPSTCSEGHHFLVEVIFFYLCKETHELFKLTVLFWMSYVLRFGLLQAINFLLKFLQGLILFGAHTTDGLFVLHRLCLQLFLQFRHVVLSLFVQVNLEYKAFYSHSKKQKQKQKQSIHTSFNFDILTFQDTSVFSNLLPVVSIK